MRSMRGVQPLIGGKPSDPNHVSKNLFGVMNVISFTECLFTPFPAPPLEPRVQEICGIPRG